MRVYFQNYNTNGEKMANIQKSDLQTIELMKYISLNFIFLKHINMQNEDIVFKRCLPTEDFIRL